VGPRKLAKPDRWGSPHWSQATPAITRGAAPRFLLEQTAEIIPPTMPLEEMEIVSAVFAGLMVKGRFSKLIPILPRALRSAGSLDRAILSI